MMDIYDSFILILILIFIGICTVSVYDFPFWILLCIYFITFLFIMYIED